MLKDIVAKRYAKALLSLALKDGKTDIVKQDLAAVAENFKASKGLQSVFLNPAFSQADKAKVLKGLCRQLKASDTSARFLDLLLEKRRFRYIREVSAAYTDLLDMHQGRVKATLTSATQLSDPEVALLRQSMKSLAGRDVEMTVEVDASLIGGVRARIGSTVYDGTISNQVKLLRDVLLKG